MVWDKLRYNYTITDYVNYSVLNVSKKIDTSYNGGIADMVGDKWRSSLSRAKRNIQEILELNLVPNSVMITLTYAENMQNYDLSNEHFKYFIKQLGSPKYLRIMELQERGAIHYHIILFEYRTKQEVENAWTVNGKIRGWIYHKEIKDITGINPITNYLAKYVTNTKKGQMIDNDKNLYTTSRDIKRYPKRKGKADDLYIYQQGIRINKNGNVKYIIPKESL